MPAKSSPVKVQDKEAPTARSVAANPKTQNHAPAVLDVADARAALQKSASPARKTRASKTVSPAEVADASAIVSEKKAPVKTLSKTTAETTRVEADKVKPVAKRSRVPKDLAAQYGGAPATDDARRPVVEANAPRKRLTRAKKEARSQLLRADDEVLQRLQQANAVEVKQPARRGRGWEFECGCCGRVTRFQTPAALCECGAIAVRE